LTTVFNNVISSKNKTAVEIKMMMTTMMMMMMLIIIIIIGL